MKQAILPVLLAALLVAACDNQTGTIVETTMPKDQNESFAKFKADLIEEFWLYNPGEALYNGYYKYDDRLTVPDEENENRQREFARRALADLSTFDVSALDVSNASDHAILKNQIEASLWYMDVFKPGEWDPSGYNVAGGFGLILNTDYKPLNDRLLVILRRLENIPAYYAAAKARLKNPTLQHTDFAILQNKGALGVFADKIPASLTESTLRDEEKAAFEPKLAAAVEAINGYVSWLEQLRPALVAGGARDFRIGEELYEQKFALDIVSGITGKELYGQAIEDKKRLHKEMISISKGLWSKYFPGTEFPENELVGVKQMIDHLSVRHVARKDFMSEIQRQMPIIQQYVIDNDLVEIDPTRPLVVRETPEYQRGFAGASVNAPGPYDATANTYYNVTPLDHYTEEQAESYLREYNHWILQVLNIHEALPGHYTQLVQANKSPSLVKSLFGNGAMIEGWAVYAERMMLESGYGDNEPEMWLMYSKWNMRVVVNTIIDYSIQVLNMSEQEVLDMLINEAFQEQTEATGKWRRATLSQVQLTSYYSGYKGIYGFREELKRTRGDKFNLKEFHDKFLSYGSAPVPVIRQLMLDEMDRPS